MIKTFGILLDPAPVTRENGGGGAAGGQFEAPAGALERNTLERMLETVNPGGGGEHRAEGSSERASEDAPEHVDGGERREPGEGHREGKEEDAERGQDGGKGQEIELDEATYGHVRELAELIQKGELNIGEVKRLRKLLAQRGEDSQTIEGLQREIEELKGRVQTRTENPGATEAEPNPFAKTVTDQATLRKAKQDLYDILEWCEDNPEGGQRGQQEFTAEQVKQLRREVKRGLDIHLPARAEQLVSEAKVGQQRNQTAAFMKQHYGQFYDRETDLGRAAAEFRNLPEVRNHPQADLVAAALALGYQELNKLETARQAKLKQAQPAPNGGGNGNRPVTRAGRIVLPPRGGGGAPRPVDGVNRAVKQFNARPGRDAFADLLEHVPVKPGRK